MLGQLNSNGDCLYATTVARQIKNDYPGCHLTWAIGSMCRSILDGNPYVDEIWEVPLASITEVAEVWPRFERAALSRKKRGDFDEVFLTQVAPGNLHNYDGGIRSSIFRAYPYPITVPVSPVLRLSLNETENVRLFAETHQLADKANVVLFECSPKSGQSFITPDFALKVTRELFLKFPDVCVILSSNVSIHSTDERIIDGSVLSFRENAELTKYCSLLIGCSSGISWLCTSSWAKPLPMIQLLSSDANWFNSVVCDHKQFGLPTSSIIEMTDCPPAAVCQCVSSVFLEGVSAARQRYHEEIKIPFGYYGEIQCQLIRKGEFIKAFSFLSTNIKKHGVAPIFFLGFLSRFLRKVLKILGLLK